MHHSGPSSSGEFVHIFQMIEKTHDGARVRRRWDDAQTPLARLLATTTLDPAARVRLERRYAETNPCALRHTIQAGLNALLYPRPSMLAPTTWRTDAPAATRVASYGVTCGDLHNAVTLHADTGRALSTWPHRSDDARTQTHHTLNGGRLPRSHSQLREPSIWMPRRSHFHLVDNAKQPKTTGFPPRTELGDGDANVVAPKGFTRSGKSAIGRAVSSHFKWPLIDKNDLLDVSHPGFPGGSTSCGSHSWRPE